MKYVLYNIRSLARHEKFIFAVMLVCIFVSAWIMTFSYGLYQNYFSLRTESDETAKSVSPQVADGQTLTRGDLKTYLDSLSDELLNGVEIIYCSTRWYCENSETPGDIIENPAVSRFTVRNGVYQTSAFVSDLWNSSGMITTGRFLTDNDEMLGTPVVLVWHKEMTDEFLRKRNKNLILDDNTAMICGKEYKIVGTHTSFGLIVPFLSISGENEIADFSFTFENAMTQRIYNELVDTANAVLPGKLIFPELDLPDRESIYIYNNIMMISVLIAALTVVNFAFLYNFIFGKRRRELAVMRICGCTAARALGICLGECCLICVPVFLCGMLTYIPFMHSVLSDVFVYMEDSYSAWIYAAIFGIYILTLIVIMGILLSRQIGKTLAESRKDGGG